MTKLLMASQIVMMKARNRFLYFFFNLMRIPYILFYFNTFFLSVSMLAYTSYRLLIFFQYVGLAFHEILKRHVNNIIFSACWPLQGQKHL